MIINYNRSEITADGKSVQFNFQVPSGGGFGNNCYFSRGVWVYNQDTIDLTNLANNHGGDTGTPNNTKFLYGPDKLWNGLVIESNTSSAEYYKQISSIVSLSDFFNTEVSAKGTDILFFVMLVKGMPDDILCKFNDGLQIVPVYQKSLLTKWLSNSSRALLNGDPADYTNHVHNMMLATAIDNAAKAGKFNLMIDYWNEFIGKRTLYDECLYNEAETFKPCNCK